MPELTNLEVLEVSLVDRPANRRRFLLTKNERDTAVEELIALILETDLENESEIDEVLKNAPEQSRDALKGALKLVNAHREDVSTEVLKSLLVKSGFVVDAVEDGTDDEGDESDAILKDDGTVDLEKVPEHLRPMIESLWKERTETAEQVETLKADIAKREEAAEMKTYLSKAEGLKLPTEDEKFAEVLRAIHKNVPEHEAFIDDLLKKMSNLLAVSKVLDEEGTTGGDNEMLSPYERAAQKAREMVKEQDGAITFEAAIDEVFKADRELSKEYAKEGK